MPNSEQFFTVVIPAAGVGKRMQANCPKQYLTINRLTILEHTVLRLLRHAQINKVIIALGANDEYFPTTSLVNHPNVSTVVGGAERVDSVLAGLKAINEEETPWVLVHDAARPCVTHQDISQLIDACMTHQHGGLLASLVRDTMKQSQGKRQQDDNHHVSETIDRSALWHAFTPQMYQTAELIQAIDKGLKDNLPITDESSAIEMAGLPSQLVEGRSDNIKITRQDDLAMAEFILWQQDKHHLKENTRNTNKGNI